MISAKKSKEAVLFCYKVLFLLADPPVNFDKMVTKAEKGTLPDDWFYNHYLDNTTMEDVIARVGKIYSLTTWEKTALKTTIMLGCSPTSNPNKK